MRQLTLTLRMSAAQVVETAVTVNNGPIQGYIHPDDHIIPQRAKKVMSDSPWLMDFVINLPYGQVKFFPGIFKLQKKCYKSC